MQVAALIMGRLFFFHSNPVCVRVGILPDCRNLPRYLRRRRTGFYYKVVILNFPQDGRSREAPKYRQLIAEVAIERLEILW
jgi:hypothetical protein